MNRYQSHSTVYEQNQPKMDAYRWILLFEGLFILFLSGLALVSMPVVLAMRFNWIWGAVGLIGIPAGLWLIFAVIRKGRTNLRRNRHPDTYRVTEDLLDYCFLHQQTGRLEKAVVPISQVEGCVVSVYVFEDYEDTELGRLNEVKFRRRVYPAFHFVVSDENDPRVISMRLTGNQHVEKLVEFIHSKQIPLYLAPVSFLNKEDRELLKSFQEPGLLIEVRPREDFYSKFFEKFVEFRFNQREGYGHIVTALPGRPDGKRNSFPFVALFAGFLALLLLGELGYADLGTRWTGFIVLVPAFLYYSAYAKGGYWKPAVFSLLSLLVCFAAMAVSYYVLTIGTGPVVSGLLTSALLFIPASYLLYPIGAVLRKRRLRRSRSSRN